MADKRVPLATGEYYHVYNRGVARQPIFHHQSDYAQALLALSYYRFEKPPVRLSRFKELSKKDRETLLDQLTIKNKVLVKIVSFVLMPNHFHFLLQQTIDNGITIFLSKLSNSYTKYINTKNKRVGPILQGVFKAVHIESNEQLIHLSRYIHLNPVVSFVIKEVELLSYPWSSLPDYIKGQSELVDSEPVLSFFKSGKDYEKFVLDQIDYGKKLEEIKHLTME
ncbi:transposase [Candidatus Daviesbacteria bacterium]|nr:transposase [Candidatus Daviesbacteria bacterium]